MRLRLALAAWLAASAHGEAAPLALTSLEEMTTKLAADPAAAAALASLPHAQRVAGQAARVLWAAQ